jgi:hypothetical protein
MRIKIDRDDARLVALVRHMYASGQSMPEIVTELRAMGVVNGTGEPLRLLHIWGILRTGDAQESR